jgi:hypothetical protein
MEPLHDDELDRLLNDAPEMRPSPAFDERVIAAFRARHTRGWRRFWHAEIRIPAPLALAAVAAAIVFMLWLKPVGKQDLNGFRPVERLEIKLVRSNNANL